MNQVKIIYHKQTLADTKPRNISTPNNSIIVKSETIKIVLNNLKIRGKNNRNHKKRT